MSFTSENFYFLLSLLVSCGSCNNLLQTTWLETTEIYCLTVLGARSLKSRCCQGLTPSGGSWEESVSCIFQLLVAGWHSLACVHITTSLSLSSHLLLLCVSVLSFFFFFFLSYKTLVMVFRVHPHNPG